MLDTINDKSIPVYIFPVNMDEKIQIKYEVAISDNFEWSLKLYGTALQHSNKHLKELPTVLKDLKIKSFVDYMLSLKICTGIADYADVLLHRLEIKLFTNNSTEIVAFVENSNRTVLKKRYLVESGTKTVHYSVRLINSFVIHVTHVRIF